MDTVPPTLALCRTELVEIDEHVARLQLDLETLQTRRKLVADHLRAFTYPVLALPVEVTTAVFEKYLEGRSPMLGPGSTICLGQICQRWRQIAVNTPALWSTLNIDLTEAYKAVAAASMSSAVKTHLLRSGTMPLTIHLECAIYANHLAEPMTRILSLLFTHSSRWRYARFSQIPVDVRLPTNLRPSDTHMPLLQRLHFLSRSSSLERVLQPLDAPALRHLETRLSLDSRFDNLFSGSWANLTVLKLMDTFIQTVLPIVRQTSTLTFLWVSLYLGNVGPMEPVALPHLHTFIVEPLPESSRTLSSFFSRLHLPGLRRLALDDNEAENNNDLQSICEALDRWGCPLAGLYASEDGYKSARNLITHAAYRAALPNVGQLEWCLEEDFPLPEWELWPS
ncbi:MFS general substrate transporter [Mycena kentingensis (nom. inval.)]|nr:MFS general substrate transporter [Mycena kentingensis (nom. inval.)]